MEFILTTLKDIGYKEMVSIELFRPEYWEWEIERTIQAGKQMTEQVIRIYFPESTPLR